MTRTLPLSVTSRVTLDGDGNGTCPPVGPTSAGETWNVSLVSVQCNTNANEAIASVFLNGMLLGTTTWGSTGDSDSSISQTVVTGQTITATWTGGDPGAIGTMTVFGTKVVA